MKKILLLISLILITSLNSFAVEEIHLEKEKINLDYFSNVYYGKVNEDVSPVLKLFSEKGITFENSYISSLKAAVVYSGSFSINALAHHSSHFQHDIDTIEPTLSLKMNDNKTEFNFAYNLLRDLDGYSNDFTKRISNLYIAHRFNKNQKFVLGQGRRLKSTYDANAGIMDRELVLKSQIGRNLGDARSFGIRNYGDYKYIEYDIGLYDSTRYMKRFGNGLDFTGHVIFKPFSDIKDKVGDFKFGGGYNFGHNNISYNMYSLYISYDYKNFHARSEYANADGYNSIVESTNRADGFYTLLSYDITPKLQLIGRYDYFVANRANTNSYCQEYTAGFTYKLFKNLKLMLNYINRNYSNKPDSNMILFATRFFI